MNTKAMTILLAAAFAGAASAATLPEGYTELTYVQCSGAQHLATGIIPSGHETRVDFQTTEYVSDGFILGTEAGYRYYSFSEYHNIYIFGYNNGSTEYNQNPRPDLKRHYLVYNRTNDYAIVLDDNVLSLNKSCASSSELFLGRRNSTTYRGRYYSCEIVEHASGEAVRNFVPAKDADGVAGFYETVEGKFYKSATSTAFIAGPDKWDFKVSAIPEQTIQQGESSEPAITVEVISKPLGRWVLCIRSGVMWM